MSGFDLSTVSDVYVGNVQYTSIYYGATLLWSAGPTITDVSYAVNTDVDNGYHVYVNKNFHFNSSHQYKIDAKVKWIANYTGTNQSITYMVGIGKYVKAEYVEGYQIYWHSSNKIYTNGLGVSYRNYGTSANEQVISDTISGLTNEYYLTLYSNIRAYKPRMNNSQIYYVTITDTTTNTVVCNLVPKQNTSTGEYFFYDTTDNTSYYFSTKSPNMREPEDLTVYANE